MTGVIERLFYPNLNAAGRQRKMGFFTSILLKVDQRASLPWSCWKWIKGLFYLDLVEMLIKGFLYLDLVETLMKGLHYLDLVETSMKGFHCLDLGETSIKGFHYVNLAETSIKGLLYLHLVERLIKGLLYLDLGLFLAKSQNFGLDFNWWVLCCPIVLRCVIFNCSFSIWIFFIFSKKTLIDFCSSLRKILSLRLETWNLELETWNLEFETWRLEFGVWNLKLEIWSLEFETWDWKFDI